MVKKFSFEENNINKLTPSGTLMVLVYEVGRLVEIHHKAGIYGSLGYLGDARKEMGDTISMCRLYCEQMNWDFEEVMSEGEEAYMERSKDIAKYGKGGTYEQR